MRDLSRSSGMSLAGLYHYFESKENLLYSIQKHTFSTIVQNLRERLHGVVDPEARIRIFIKNHLEYFLANQKAMKVLSHEADVLKNGYGAEVAAIKREYYRICLGLIDDLKDGLAQPRFFQPAGRTWPIRNDELDLYLAQPAHRRRCRTTGAADGRHFFAGSDEIPDRKQFGAEWPKCERKHCAQEGERQEESNVEQRQGKTRDLSAAPPQKHRNYTLGSRLFPYAAKKKESQEQRVKLSKRRKIEILSTAGRVFGRDNS